MQQLLAHIREGLIDVVVVYKVDRLTRALADFARMVELFDNQSVSFVAVTQQFNTTTSMGRLTLNVLLSFAQFEREVIGERIRDKVAASKRKGIWMGGTLPLGYDVRERKLVINQDEARVVREVFARYLELGSVRELKNDLDQRGIISAVKLSRKGDRRGGKPDGVDFVWNFEISSFPQNPPPAVLWYYYTSTHAGQSPLGEAKGCDQEPEVKSSSRTGPNGSAAVTADLLLIPRRRVHLRCTARVPKERPPVPDQQNRDDNIVHGIDAGDRFDRNRDSARRRGRPDPVSERHEQAFERIAVGHLRHDHDEGDEPAHPARPGADDPLARLDEVRPAGDHRDAVRAGQVRAQLGQQLPRRLDVGPVGAVEEADFHAAFSMTVAPSTSASLPCSVTSTAAHGNRPSTVGHSTP